MNIEVDLNEVRIGETEVRLPHTISTWVVAETSVVVCTASYSSSQKEHDIALPSDARNLVCIGQDGRRRWFVDIPEHSQTEKPRFEYVFELSGRLLTRHTNGNTYEINWSDGSLIKSWANDELPIGDAEVQLPGPHFHVHETEYGIFVKLRGADVSLMGFEHDGTERWRRDGRGGVLWDINGQLIEEVATGPRQTEWYVLDSGTGERIEEIERPSCL